MRTKEYIQSVMDENNKRLKAYITDTIAESIRVLRISITQEILNALEDNTYDKEEIVDIIDDKITDYDIEARLAFISSDSHYIVTSDGYVFCGSNEREIRSKNPIITSDNKYIVTSDNKIFSPSIPS